MYDPFSEQSREDPYPIYAALRDDSPAYRSPDGSFWALSRHRDVHSALTDWQTYSSAAGVNRPGELMDIDPPRHDAIRRLFAPRFSHALLPVLENVIRTGAEQLLDGRHRLGTAIDISRDYAQRLCALTSCRVFGLPERHVAATVDDVTQLIWPEGDRDPTAARMRARSSLADRFLALTSEQAKTGEASCEPNLIGDIARAVAGQAIALEDVPGLCLMFTVAGTEPAANLLSNIIHALATDQVTVEQLRDANGDVMASAINEFARYDGPVQWVSRFTTRVVAVHSTEIPAGARVLLLIGSANRDPRAYRRPDEFDPSRASRGQTASMAFGAGVHACMGAALARLQTRVAVEVMLERLSRPTLAGPARRGRSHVLRGFDRLPVCFR
jgi:cytochrome P450